MRIDRIRKLFRKDRRRGMSQGGEVRRRVAQTPRRPTDTAECLQSRPLLDVNAPS